MTAFVMPFPARTAWDMGVAADWFADHGQSHFESAARDVSPVLRASVDASRSGSRSWSRSRSGSRSRSRSGSGSWSRSWSGSGSWRVK
jgi:hypothetical protein